MNGMPDWMPAGALAAAVARSVSVLGALDAHRENESILLAEDAQGRRLSFIYATLSQDGLSGESLGYVSESAVAAEAEGRGAARRLLDAAEHWSQERGAAAMTLRVFHTNTHARAIYEHLGYELEVALLRKRFGAPVDCSSPSPSYDPGGSPDKVPG